MKKWILVAVLALFGAAAVCASPAPGPDKPQKKEKVKAITVSGTVKDEAGKSLAEIVVRKILILGDDMQPLIGATIMLKGTPYGTQTDDYGRASIICENCSVLVISYLGYQQQEILVTTKTNYVVQMKYNDADL